MNLVKALRDRHGAWKRERAESLTLRGLSAADEITRPQWADSLSNPTEFYERCFGYFHTSLPATFRDHRTYFEADGRGFGEKSFHVMWFLLFREFLPESFLEIGVYRGQTLSLAALLARHFRIEASVHGISPFSAAGDTVSNYRHDIDYYVDTCKNFEHFSLPPPSLLKAFSTDEEALRLIASRDWACIYIDGNHEYLIARRDWEVCAAHVRVGGLIVLDDSGLHTKYKPPAFATAGHPGPSRLAREIDRAGFTEILQIGHNRVFEKIST